MVVPLVTFSLVWVPPVWLGSLGLVWEPLVTVSFGLGTLSFVRIPIVCLGTLGLVGLPQFGAVLSVWLGYPCFGGSILFLVRVPLVWLGYPEFGGSSRFWWGYPQFGGCTLS